MLSAQERSFLYSYLARTLKHGLSPAQALHAYLEDIDIKNHDSRRLKQAIILLKTKNLASALYETKLITKNESTILCYAKERAESLSPMLLTLSAQIQKTALLQRKCKTLLIYPIILVVEFIIVLGMAIFWLVPQLSLFFTSLHMPAPFLFLTLAKLRQTLMHIASLYQFYWIIILLCILWLMYQIITVPIVLHRIQFLPLHLYKIGRLYRLALVQKIISMLTVLAIRHKAIGHREITLLAQSTDNLVYKKALDELAKHLLKGGTYAQFFKKRSCKKLFPCIARRMFILGEKQNNLPQELRALSKILTEDVETEIKHFISILEPALIMGIAGLILALALTLQNIVGQMQNGI